MGAWRVHAQRPITISHCTTRGHWSSEVWEWYHFSTRHPTAVCCGITNIRCRAPEHGEEGVLRKLGLWGPARGHGHAVSKPTGHNGHSPLTSHPTRTRIHRHRRHHPAACVCVLVLILVLVLVLRGHQRTRIRMRIEMEAEARERGGREREAEAHGQRTRTWTMEHGH